MHKLILGQSFTGKSALAKQLGTALRAQGQVVIAYNPTREAGYTARDAFECQAAQFESSDPEKFVAEINRLHREGHNKIFLIIDEAHEFFTRKDCAYSWIGTRGRHYGLTVIAITQRAANINVTFRSQCSTIYAFRANKSDMEFLREEFWHRDLSADDLKLPDGEYLKISKDGISRGNITDW